MIEPRHGLALTLIPLVGIPVTNASVNPAKALLEGEPEPQITLR